MKPNHLQILLFCAIYVSPTISTIYQNLPYVEDLHPQDLYEMIRDQPEGLWVIQFYNTSDPNIVSYSNNFTLAAKSMQGYVKSASINIQDHIYANLVLGIITTPTYIFYGYYKHLPEKITTIETVDDLHEEASKQLVHFFEERSVYRYINNKYNMEMSSGDLDNKLEKYHPFPWMVVFYKRENPKSVKFVEIWDQLVNKFHERINFGAVNNPLYEVFDVKEEDYPQIKFYPTTNIKGEIYDGVLTLEALEEYLDSVMITPKVLQVTNANVAESCLRHKFCILMFLPDPTVCNDDCKLSYIGILTDASQEYRRKSWAWFWNEYKEQPEVEEALGIDSDDGGKGTIVVVNVHGAVFMKTVLGAELTKEVMDNIILAIKEDDRFDFRIDGKALPDIKRIVDFCSSRHVEL